MAHRLIALQAEKVIVADDHPLFRTAIKEALQASQGETTFLEALSSHLSDVSKWNSDFNGPNGEDIPKEQIAVLNEVIELLGLFEEIPSN